MSAAVDPWILEGVRREHEDDFVGRPKTRQNGTKHVRRSKPRAQVVELKKQSGVWSCTLNDKVHTIEALITQEAVERLEEDVEGGTRVSDLKGCIIGLIQYEIKFDLHPSSRAKSKFRVIIKELRLVNTVKTGVIASPVWVESSCAGAKLLDNLWTAKRSDGETLQSSVNGNGTQLLATLHHGPSQAELPEEDWGEEPGGILKAAMFTIDSNETVALEEIVPEDLPPSLPPREADADAESMDDSSARAASQLLGARPSDMRPIPLRPPTAAATRGKCKSLSDSDSSSDNGGCGVFLSLRRASGRKPMCPERTLDACPLGHETSIIVSSMSTVQSSGKSTAAGGSPLGDPRSGANQDDCGTRSGSESSASKYQSCSENISPVRGRSTMDDNHLGDSPSVKFKQPLRRHHDDTSPKALPLQKLHASRVQLETIFGDVARDEVRMSISDSLDENGSGCCSEDDVEHGGTCVGSPPKRLKQVPRQQSRNRVSSPSSWKRLNRSGNTSCTGDEALPNGKGPDTPILFSSGTSGERSLIVVESSNEVGDPSQVSSSSSGALQCSAERNPFDSQNMASVRCGSPVFAQPSSRRSDVDDVQNPGDADDTMDGCSDSVEVASSVDFWPLDESAIYVAEDTDPFLATQCESEFAGMGRDAVDSMPQSLPVLTVTAEASHSRAAASVAQWERRQEQLQNIDDPPRNRLIESAGDASHGERAHASADREAARAELAQQIRQTWKYIQLGKKRCCDSMVVQMPAHAHSERLARDEANAMETAYWCRNSRAQSRHSPSTLGAL